MREYTELPKPGDTNPMVGVQNVDGHVTMWTVTDGWACSCEHKRSASFPYCRHIVVAAMALPWRLSNELVNFRRDAGIIPASVKTAQGRYR